MDISATDVIDEVAFDPENQEIVLILRAFGPWGDDESLVALSDPLKEKVSSYITFAFAGQLAEAFPEHKDKKVRIQIDCDEMPPQAMLILLEKIDDVVKPNGARLLINHRAPAQP